ncbi:MAG: OmpA family protein, partial [Hydrogenophilaceae bacterium]
KRVRLGTDGLFTYKKSALADLLPDGVRKLDELVDNLLGTGEIDRLTVVGHTDRIGSDGYNLKLSQARADTVREYLVAKGIQADRITATGVGEAVPLVQCEETKRAALIKCLQPNRRVEIEAWSLRKQQ